MARKKNAYSLVELIVIVAIMGAVAFIAVPRLQFATLRRKQADTIAAKIVTDLRRARALAISDAAANSAGFALNMTGGSPYTGYEIENLDTSATINNGIFSIDSQINCTGGDEFQFGPLGNLLVGSDTALTVAAEGKIFTITIVSATGTIKCSGN